MKIMNERRKRMSRQKKSRRLRPRRELVVEKCEERTLLAGGTFDPSAFVVQLSAAQMNVPSAQALLVSVDSEQPGEGDTVRLRVSQIEQNQYPFRLPPASDRYGDDLSGYAEQKIENRVRSIFQDLHFLNTLLLFCFLCFCV